MGEGVYITYRPPRCWMSTHPPPALERTEIARTNALPLPRSLSIDRSIYLSAPIPISSNLFVCLLGHIIVIIPSCAFAGGSAPKRLKHAVTVEPQWVEEFRPRFKENHGYDSGKRGHHTVRVCPRTMRPPYNYHPLIYLLVVILLLMRACLATEASIYPYVARG